MSLNPTAARLRSAMSRMVTWPSTGSSAFGSPSVSGRSRRPAPAARTIPINRVSSYELSNRGMQPSAEEVPAEKHQKIPGKRGVHERYDADDRGQARQQHPSVPAEAKPVGGDTAPGPGRVGDVQVAHDQAS